MCKVQYLVTDGNCAAGLFIAIIADDDAEWQVLQREVTAGRLCGGDPALGRRIMSEVEHGNDQLLGSNASSKMATARVHPAEAPAAHAAAARAMILRRWMVMGFPLRFYGYDG